MRSEFFPELYNLYNGQTASMEALTEEGSAGHVQDLIDRGVTNGQMDLAGDIVVFPINYDDYKGKEATFFLPDAEFYSAFQQ